MGDGVGVPPFREHRNANHTFNVFSKLARLAYSIHHFPQQVFVGKVVRIPARKTGTIIRLKLVNFTGGDLLEVVAHRLAGFELLAVH